MGKHLSPAKIGNVLAYAQMHGDKSACKHYGVTDRTLRRYRKKYGSGPFAIEEEPAKKSASASDIDRTKAREKKKAALPGVSDGRLRDRVRETRLHLLNRLQVLAATSDDLKAVAGAYKLVTDGEIAQKVVAPDGQPIERAQVEDDGGPDASGDAGADDAPPVH